MTSLLSRLEIRYGSALAAVAGAWLLRSVLDARLGDHHPYSLFLIVVLLVAWYVGTGPAVLAFTLGAIVANLAFVPPRHELSFPSGEQQAGFLIFVTVGIAGILASRAMRKTEHRAEKHRLQAARRGDELRRSEERFRRLALSMPQIVWTAAADGTVTFINEGWQEYTGLTLEQTNHLDHLRRVIHPEDAPRVIERWRASIETGASQEGQWRFRRRSDGAYRWFLTRAVPVRDEAGRIREWFGTATDIDDQKRTEAELRHSEERLRLALDAGQMQPWEWALSASGPSDITGVAPFDGVHPEDAPLVREAAEKALETGGFAAEFRVRGPEGRERWLEGKGGVVRDPSGRPSSLRGVAFDVTKRREAEEALRHSERLYRAIGESINYGIWVCDSRGRNIYASESFLRLVGLTQQECAEFGWGNALDPEEAESTIAAWKECVRGGASWEREHRFKGVDGEWHHLLARGVPIRDDSGAIVCWAGINLDIGVLKQAQQDLKEADRRKDEFLAILAHELRNPLAPLCNGLELLQLCRGDEGKVEEVQTMMARQLSHLVRLVDDLLDVSRISRGKFELRTELVTLEAVIRNALETIRPTAASRGHELTVTLPEEPLYLRADAVRLAQVFSNLLDNACKYTEKPGRITVHAGREGDSLTVSVADTGVGIPPESIDTVFDLFTQVDRSRERVVAGGLGIGLSLVRGLVERHGGTVEATSDGAGRGSTFLVRLPLARPETISAAPAEEPEAPSNRTGRILVVDDNRDSAKSLAMILQARGHDVRTAFDGASAIEAARSFLPSFILLDIGMPGVNGYDAARRIREEPFGRDVVLIAMTGWGQAEDRRRSELAGFDAHLTKPVDVSSLYSLLVGPPDQRRKRPSGGIKTPAAG